MKISKYILSIFVALLVFTHSNAAEKWDMALAYGAGNFHSANATEFANNVTKKSKGKLTIVTHPGGSLFKGGEIFRAVRTGQAPIGERFMSALGKEDPLLEIDSLPFLATSYGDAMKLYKASKAEISKSLDKKGLVLFGSHTSAKKVSIENHNFKALTVKDLNELKVETVFNEVKSKLN